MSREIRTISPDELRVEARADGKKIIKGYAALYNAPSELMYGYFRETIARGAFASCIKSDDVRALFNHEPGCVLGRNTAGTLELRDDNKGLWMEAQPPDTQAGRDVVTLIERRDVTGQSFSFDIDWDDKEAQEWHEVDGIVNRVIKKFLRLYDVGPVTYPAYPDTDIATAQRALFVPDRVRSMAEKMKLEARAQRPDVAAIAAGRNRSLDLLGIE